MNLYKNLILAKIKKMSIFLNEYIYFFIFKNYGIDYY